MKKLITLFVALLMGNAVAEKVIHASPSGNDTWSGSESQPLATVEAAQTAVRKIIAAGLTEPVTVYLHGGTYYPKSGLVFGNKDKGTSAYPITYRAAPNEKPIISGGTEISSWTQQGKFFTASVSSAQSGNRYFRRLYTPDTLRRRARGPAGENFYRAAGAVAGKEYGGGHYFKEGDMQAYQNLEDVDMVLYQTWNASNHWLKSIDMAQRTATWESGIWFNIGGWFVESNFRYYVEGAMELLDEPGEWYYNRTDSKIYYNPRPGESVSSFKCVIPRMANLVRIDSCEYLRFAGLSFRHTDYDRSAGAIAQAHEMINQAMIYCTNTKNSSFTGCELALGGSHAMFFEKGSYNDTVQQCHIHDMGGGGVYVGESGWKASKLHDAGSVVVDNCFIHGLSTVFHGSIGVWIGNSSNNTVTHCDISDNDCCGLSVGWSWRYQAYETAHHNRIEFNNVHHIGHGELKDFAGIYTLGQSKGTVIRNNIFHHVKTYKDEQGHAIYQDESSRNLLIENNLCYQTSTNGWLFHWGDSLTLRNNIFAWAGQNGIFRARDAWESYDCSFDFTNNIVLTYKGTATSGSWGKNNFTMDKNCYWDIYDSAKVLFNSKSFADWQAAGHDMNSRLADPQFSVPLPTTPDQFTLKSSSPALALGFNQIDYSKIGLYGDASWTSRPSKLIQRPIYATMKVTNVTNNIAYRRPVVASSRQDVAALAVDGNGSTRWGSNYHDPEWIYVDLEAKKKLRNIVLKWETACAKEYKLQVADDTSHWTDVYSTTTSQGGEESIDVSGSGRYVRVYGIKRATEWGYSLWEFEVYEVNDPTSGKNAILETAMSPQFRAIARDGRILVSYAGMEKNGSLALYDIKGALIGKHTLAESAGQSVLTGSRINSSGFYIVRYSSPGYSQTKRVHVTK